MKTFAIRLRRSGRWSRPTYTLVAMFKDSRTRGFIFEKLGFYSPTLATKLFFINFDRVAYWLLRGAVPSSKVTILLGKLFKIVPSRKPTTKVLG